MPSEPRCCATAWVDFGLEKAMARPRQNYLRAEGNEHDPA